MHIRVLPARLLLPLLLVVVLPVHPLLRDVVMLLLRPKRRVSFPAPLLSQHRQRLLLWLSLVLLVIVMWWRLVLMSVSNLRGTV